MKQSMTLTLDQYLQKPLILDAPRTLLIRLKGGPMFGHVIWTRDLYICRSAFWWQTSRRTKYPRWTLRLSRARNSSPYLSWILPYI